jgi:hypothetical protein
MWKVPTGILLIIFYFVYMSWIVFAWPSIVGCKQHQFQQSIIQIFFNREKQQKWDSQSKCPLLNENHHNRNNPHKICDVVFIANQIPIGKNPAFQHIVNSLLSATSVHLDQNLGDKNQQFPKFLKRTSLCMH